MRLVPRLFLLLAIPLLGTPAIAAPADDPAAGPDEQTLKAAGLASDGPALLAFFRTRTRLEADRAQLNALVRQLGDSSAEVRDRAVADLVTLGSLAVPLLRHAVNDLDNLETAAQARRCLQLIEGTSGAAIPSTAARLLALRKPAGAAEALLAYLPYADDPHVTEQVAAALAAVAFVDGQPDPVLVRALEDKVPVRRAVAAEALCRSDRPETLPLVRKLLKDPKPTVRLRVALALAHAQDETIIPVLIDLVGELPPAQRKQAEEYLGQLAGEWAPNIVSQGDDEVVRRIRRDAWAAWWRNTDGPTLLDEFRKRTLTDADLQRLRSLVQQLGDPSFEVRERSVNELVARGNQVVPLLQQAIKGEDREISRRAGTCLKLIDKGRPNALPVVAARLVALRKPAGAAEVLLAYLPFAEDDAMSAEVLTTLTAVALRAGKPEPVLVKALADPLALRRATAAEALCRAGGADQRQRERPLLKDPDPLVRLRVALVLAGARERDAIPVLIDLLGDLTTEQAGPAQEILYVLAGDKAPSAVPGSDTAARQKYRDAWAAWWRDQGSAIDLARLDHTQRTLGYTLLVEVDDSSNGRVRELGLNNKPRWQIENIPYPVDAFVLPGNRVLITEYNGRRVTERDFKGNILWEKGGFSGRAVNAQRLANGNTFIATDSQLLEVDRAGKEVFSVSPPGGVTAAYKAPNGHIFVLASRGVCLHLDATGKELKSFPSNRSAGWTSGIDLAPNGRVLISQPDRNKVAEFSADGKMVWEADAPQITTATRAPNGNTIVASYPSRRVFELNSKGKVVWEFTDTHHIFRARRR